VNTGGEKVFAEEVEEVVKTHEAVDDCLVVGVPDETFGHRVVAVVALSAPVEERDLIAHTKAHLASFKAPRQVVVVERVPRAPNGKADYKAAKAVAEGA
jgi:fatty-acyl-CoA synthase